MEKIGIVILNYLNYLDTIQCLKSIMALEYKNTEIIVVENGSPNESLQKLQEFLRNYPEVHLLVSTCNLGFAQGNNLGILYSRERLQTDFVLVVNNDTLFEQRNFFINMLKDYHPGVAVIGPRIRLLDGQYQNPVFPKSITTETIRQEWYEAVSRYYGIERVYYKIRNTLYQIKNKEIPSQPKGNPWVHQKEEYSEKLEGIELVLHGACFLLTPSYFMSYPCLIPDTFLYYEEIILALITAKAGLNKVYCSTAEILHLEDRSSTQSFQNDNKVKLRYHIKSMRVARKLSKLSVDKIKHRYFMSTDYKSIESDVTNL